ncbi:trans-sialidase, putative [Trypanosoma cruzi marinkellei]|uniref:Trans-sialidase, putative n=1 Tax=Trypanosoma cruzi marinkellei TaxID=85056 RepID=K2MG90_TRYCR|nr:trans-sialidase, putative [Trypanosoma cruzi marinkellei]
MGVKMNDDEKTVLMGLSYNKKEKKWELLCSGGTFKELSSNWEPKKAHQLALVLRNGTQGFAYVDGQRVGEASCKLKNTDSKGISHFYIGGGEGTAGSQEGVSVTVRNVLLYNRPLTFSGTAAEVEEDIPPPSEADSHTVTKDTNAAPLANQNSEAPAWGSSTTQQVPAASNSHAGEAHGDGGTYCGNGLLPLLLLLLGLWGFATL